MFGLLAALTAAALISTMSPTPADAVEATTVSVSGIARLGGASRVAGAGEVKVIVTTSPYSDSGPSALTAADGSFVIPDVPVGAYAGVKFINLGATDSLNGWYDGEACGSECPWITLSADVVLDHTLPAGRGPQGVVRNTAGSPLRGIMATLQRRDAVNPVWYEQQVVTTGADGRYRFAQVFDGIYRIVFRDPASVYATQNQAGTAPDDTSKVIDMRNGAVPAAIDVKLRRAGSLSVQVKTLGLLPASSTYYLDLERRTSDGAWRIIEEDVVVSASKSTFARRGLYPGTYRVRGHVSGGGFEQVKISAFAIGEGAAVTGTVTFKTDENGPNRDFSGDRRPDVLAISKTGSLLMYPGRSDGSLASSKVIGSGWTAFDHVFAVGDFSGDGLPDLLARDRTGALWLYRGNGVGGWRGGGIKVGTGWQGFTAIYGAGDFNGDGANDVIARDTAGRLRLYPGNGSGGFRASSQIGSGWGSFKTLIGDGDIDGNGTDDTLVVSNYLVPASGRPDLVVYRATGTGSWMSGSKVIGYGFSPYNVVLGAGNRAVIARDTSGRLWRSTSPDWGAPFGAPKQIGTGWSTLRFVR
ncbi:FG-GAP-like repeat-containing protein [Agromyces endophyticus]|uniref:FG-GAP repeat domain-containing protein n=1 Tax=Agromyces sp. H17E-10 TaxID=2932244 RepID=UPI001FD0B33C|nr:VCBS repeat-containing protein [Agromyces sp. H17E-10]UOQ90233.1 FG-GAP-like repeat-containing protein [Agromyces sp. H17E-10]